MNVKIALSKEEAIQIYCFLFREEGVHFESAGSTFMQDLAYPLSMGRPDSTWMFSSGGVLWFLKHVKMLKMKDVRCDEGIHQIIRKLANAYMALLNELVPDDPDPKSPEATSRPAD